MRRMFSQLSHQVDEENPYWMSFSDLMSAILVIFILAAVALIIELTQKNQKVDDGINELKKAQQARKDILVEVREELERRNVQVLLAENDTIIRVPEKTLSFESGKHQIPADELTLNAVKQIGIVLQQAIKKNERFKYLDTVFVEGHTDSIPIYYNGKGNWGLSVDRAISIWQLWQTQNTIEPKLADMTNAFGQKLFSVSGYAATRRIQLEESTDEQKAANRRIDIRFTVKRPTISELERIAAR